MEVVAEVVVGVAVVEAVDVKKVKSKGKKSISEYRTYKVNNEGSKGVKTKATFLNGKKCLLTRRSKESTL